MISSFNVMASFDNQRLSNIAIYSNPFHMFNAPSCVGCSRVWFMEVFSKCIRFEVGVGDRVKFWTDQWCGDLPLHLSFPVVYGIATNRKAFVASSLEQLGSEAWRS